MEFVVTSEQERRRQIEDNLRNIEMEYHHSKAMLEAGVVNFDPARGAVTAPPLPGWERRGLTDEQVVQKHLQKLEEDHARLLAARRAIIEGRV